MAATNVQALVLIYDIRGFTSASKRIGTADLGSFATAAHRVILDLFSACPPTFVKNLGDGHLLVWEAPDGLGAPLLDPVMAAAQKAQMEFAAFVAGQGALGTQLPKQVGVGIAFGETFKSDDYYGLAMNLAARLQNEARPEGLAMSETVFEQAARRDERLRREFRRARVHLKGLGSTIMWVKRPFSWARVVRPLLPWAVALAAGLLYVLLADAGLGWIFAERVRRILDARQWSLFRAPRSEAEVRSASAAWRSRYLEFFDRARLPDGWIRNGSTEKDAGESDAWTSAQAFTAILRTPDAPPERLRAVLRDLASLFAPGRFVEVDGVAYGWEAHPRIGWTGAEPALWTSAAVAIALGRAGLIPEADRPLWLERLKLAQRAAMLHHPAGDGGWNQFPNQEDLGRHSPYTSALALLALLEAHASGVPWNGAPPLGPLKKTVAWLVAGFDSKAPVPGWRGTPLGNDRVSEGLTLQIYAELLRAESEAGIAVAPEIHARITGQLTDLVGKALKEAYDAGENQVRFQSHLDRAESARRGMPVWSVGTESVNFLWHPWGIEAAVRWLDRARRLGGADAADLTRVRRSLGHLVGDLGEDAFREATSGFTYVASETLYGLSVLR